MQDGKQKIRVGDRRVEGEGWRGEDGGRRMEAGEAPAGISGRIFPAVFQSHPKVAELPSAAGWALERAPSEGRKGIPGKGSFVLQSSPSHAGERKI